MFMSATPILSTSTTAPPGAEAGRLTLSDLLVLIIVQLLILWTESLAESLRERTDTTDLTDITRAFGTTDIALILERVTVGLQRLRALEDMILGRNTGLDSDPQANPTATASTRHSPAARQPRRLNPASAGLLTSEQVTAPPVRATGPPRPQHNWKMPQRGRTILSHPRGMAGPVMPIPRHAPSP
jgi:hypothetical protein